MDTLNEQQEKRMADLGRAAINMSHGIKNIAQSIHAGREVMDKALEVGDIDRARRTWNMLSQSVDRIQKLSLDMLTYSKDEKLSLTSCDLNHLVKSAVETVHWVAVQREIAMTVQLDDTLQQVDIDPDKMTDAILNLLINAIEAIEPKTGRVVIQTEHNDNNVVLHIRDNGPGVKDPELIFRPYHSTKNNIGAGLGLAIARQTVEKHGGTIEVKSPAGEETTFTVRILQ